MSREFQFWQYGVSHGELLVRSPKDALNSRNVDLMFAGVEYVDLPRFLANLRIETPSDEDVARAEERLGKVLERENVFVLGSGGRRYLVVAGVMKVAESDMDIFDNPFE